MACARNQRDNPPWLTHLHVSSFSTRFSCCERTSHPPLASRLCLWTVALIGDLVLGGRHLRLVDHGRHHHRRLDLGHGVDRLPVGPVDRDDRPEHHQRRRLLDQPRRRPDPPVPERPGPPRQGGAMRGPRHQRDDATLSDLPAWLSSLWFQVCLGKAATCVEPPSTPGNIPIGQVTTPTNTACSKR